MKKPKLRRNTPEEERRIHEGIAADPDNPEWSDEDFRRGRPGGRGPQKSPTKIRTTVRFSAEVLSMYKGLGKGWQTRMDQDLRELVARKYRQVEQDGELVTVERCAGRRR